MADHGRLCRFVPDRSVIGESEVVFDVGLVPERPSDRIEQLPKVADRGGRPSPGVHLPEKKLEVEKVSSLAELSGTAHKAHGAVDRLQAPSGELDDVGA